MIINKNLKMKKAFSLLEAILSLALFSLLLILFSKPLMSISDFYSKHKILTHKQVNANLALLFIDKILQDCIELSLSNSGFSCLKRDFDNVLLQRNSQFFIGYSGLLLQDANLSFYSPKSLLLDKNSNPSVLLNQQTLHNFKKDKLLFYSLKDKSLYEAKILDKERILFLKDDFQGFYVLLDAKLTFRLSGKELIYEYEADNKLFSSILLDEVENFELRKENAMYELKICAKDFCLSKWSLSA